MSALTKRTAIKWICRIKKELKSSAEPMKMIKGGLHKRNKTGITDTTGRGRSYCPDCRHRTLAQSI
ncbi:hypothetical protein HMPREF1981_01642 [Bacteroides pyogenes F0041]|uniref:Uncharacterized protein n=1 Tax=Bacteroides pyogenes F0041 TaxID=1321819 RepID=U2CLP7_9BACE|nr:hypothetical protein HMPREF1981_01642 [Bacteroides pyogenes F0041]